ncbi:DUF3413 domain-containing protein [Planctobacterium marinum]|uniref:DUF3413 domain-containing protein n=1 Tax=Planctobacterium marinum TaxID=1631968 RepID=UPI001E54ECBE|nr:DUF3413 domain-containing protein [Planctobacterium marinum]MCC2604246.1 DUF3413 domain-containing protein [Planctobacterium marinum]
MILTETPKRQLVSKLVTWGHWFTLCNIIVAICIAGIYLFSSALPETALGLFYLIANWFSHIGFLTFFGFVIFMLPLCYLLPNSRFLRAWGSTVAAFGLAFLAFDALLYTRHGLHFSPYSAEFIRQQTDTVLAGLKFHQIIFLLVSFFAWLLFQLLVANSLWQRIERLQKLKIGLPISFGFVTLFMFSHIVHVWADANLYQPVVKQDNMFPLSYPATAKTLLSKYGLLDIEQYRTKKTLQFNNQFERISYPKSSLFCATNPDKKAVLILVDDALETHIERSSPAFGKMLPQHFDLSTSKIAGIKTALYGLPEVFHANLSNKSPILLQLITASGQQVFSYSADDTVAAFFTQHNTVPVQTQSESGEIPAAVNNGLYILHVNASQAEQWIQENNGSTPFLMTYLNPDTRVPAYTNLPVTISNELTSHQDIAATLINYMGCAIQDNLHSTGENLLSGARNWIVSNQQNKIIILHNQLRTEVDPSGNYQLYNLDGSPQNNVELNIPLLGQAIKLLSSFSQAK